MSGLNATPSGERIRIGIFGRRNAGKSSVINALTGQELAIVSPVLGTTTDPVLKNMELLPLGPVTLIDTPGIDDAGELGALRVKKSYEVLNKADLALLVVDAVTGLAEEEKALLGKLHDKAIPTIVVFNKIDQLTAPLPDFSEGLSVPVIGVSAAVGTNIYELKEMMGKLFPNKEEKTLLRDLFAPGDAIILVVPIDKAAPKGRLILPQQQAIRDILDGGGLALVCQPQELGNLIADLHKKPKLVVCDSQVFAEVDKIVPREIPLTSFSILMARYKGDLPLLVDGVERLQQLKDGDQILISEGCTHHRQCNDIGTVKLPQWINQLTGKTFQYHFTSGGHFPEDLSAFQLIVHCGACMLTEREVLYRIQYAHEHQVPITNYGVLIAYIHGILPRTLEPFALELKKNKVGE